MSENPKESKEKDNESTPFVFRWTAVAKPIDEEAVEDSDLEIVCYLEIPNDDYNPYDFLSFIHFVSEESEKVFQHAMNLAVEKYLEVNPSVSAEYARADLENYVRAKSQKAEEEPLDSIVQ